MWWEILMAIALFMYLMCAPVIVAFEFRRQIFFIDAVSGLCSLFDIFFIADIVVTFYTGYTCDRLRMVILDHYSICMYGIWYLDASDPAAQLGVKFERNLTWFYDKLEEVTKTFEQLKRCADVFDRHCCNSNVSHPSQSYTFLKS